MAAAQAQTYEARVGVDLVPISRMEQVVKRTPSFLQRVFTEHERHYCEYAPYPFEHYAARFAAREACLKALGIGWQQGVRFQDVSVTNDESGAPHLVLAGHVRKVAEELGIEELAVSLSHTSRLAVANVVALPKVTRAREQAQADISEAKAQKAMLSRTFKDARKIVAALDEATEQALQTSVATHLHSK